jgi:hypothetical protein
VNWSEAPEVVVPATVVTVISTVPGLALGGETALIWVSELTAKLEAAAEPNLTALAPVKSWPVITTDLPPVTEPLGEPTAVMPGGGWTSALKAISALSGPKIDCVVPSASAGSQPPDSADGGVAVP